MKVLFLDIDGVLNSMTHYERVKSITKEPLDPSSVHCLGEIIRQSHARIVLSSTWRGGWDPDPASCKLQGNIINDYLKKEKLMVYDKTPNLNIADPAIRCKEIKAWLRKCPYTIDNIAILDDADYLWKKHGLSRYWVQTDFQKNGLSKEHIEACVTLLQKKNHRFFLRNLWKKKKCT